MNYDPATRPTAEGHPIDALIAGYAAKTLSPPLTALVAAHLELKPDNRAYVAALEAVHGVFLEDLRPVPLAGRDRRLVNIFVTPEPGPTPPAPMRLASDAHAMLPRALRRFAGCDAADLPWRSRGFGIREAVLREGDGSPKFVTARPGKRLPLRGETGLAAVLVLAGHASDGRREYGRGDIIFVADDREDEPLVTGEAECLCFVVLEDLAKEPGALRRALHRVIGG